MRRLRGLAILLLALGASACQDAEPGCARLSRWGRYCLQPSTVAPAFEAQQQVLTSIRGQKDTLIASLEVDAAGVRFVGLTPLGQTLVQVDYDNHRTVARSVNGLPLDAAVLLGLLQIALWPENAVRAGLSPNLTLVSDGTHREVQEDGKSILLIDHDASPAPHQFVRLSMPALDFELHITTLDTPLSPPAP